MQSRTKRAGQASSNKRQITRSFESAEIGQGVRTDDTVNPEKRGECFAPSVEQRILDKKPGFGAVRPTMEDHTGNKGHDTLSSDSRKSSMPSAKGNKIELNQKRNNEDIIYEGASTTVTDGETKARK